MISVVIPAYNAEDTIEMAVRSALSQTEKELEVIVVDDGSQDATWQTVERLMKEDRRVKGIHQENAGVSAARNTGIHAASGRYLMTLDDDDTIDPDMLQKLKEAMEEGGSDLAICGIRLVYPDHTELYDTDENPPLRTSEEKTSEQKTTEKGVLRNTELNCGENSREKYREKAEPVSGESVLLREFLEKQLLRLYDRHLLTTHSNKLYDLNLIRENAVYYDPALQINEDTDFVLRYLAHCRKVSLIPGTYLNYMQHGTGQSLITTFRRNGVSSALMLKDDLEQLYQKLESSTAHVKKNDPGSKGSDGNALISKVSNNRDCREKTSESEDTAAFDALKAGMDHRLLVHILSCAGLMYSRSSMNDAEILQELRSLNENTSFRQLLTRTKPQDMKTAVAKFLLEHRLTRLYHRVCKIMYKKS